MGITLTKIEWGLLKKDCPSGKLTKEKFNQMYKSLYPSGNTEEFVDHIFRTFDTDNNGTIDFTEFLLAVHMTSTDKAEDKLKWLQKSFKNIYLNYVKL